MSAQMYLARLINEGRADRGPHAAALRREGLSARQARRVLRARENRTH